MHKRSVGVWCVVGVMLALTAGALGADLDLVALVARDSANRAAGKTTANEIEQITTRERDGQTMLVPVEMIRVGFFSYVTFKGADAVWSAYDTLELDCTCEGEGQMSIMLYEEDKGRQEAWNIRLDNLGSGDHSLSFVLGPKPDGSLNLNGAEDGVWNPDGNGDVQVFSDYPRGFQIKRMVLKKTASDGEAE